MADEIKTVENIRVGGQTYAITDSTKVKTTGDVMSGSLTMGTTSTPVYIYEADEENVMRSVPVAKYTTDNTNFSDIKCISYYLNNGTLTIIITTKTE